MERPHSKLGCTSGPIREATLARQAGPENLPNDPASSLELTPAQIQQLADSLASGDGLDPCVQYRTYESEYVRQTGAFNYVCWRRRGTVNQPPRAPLVVDDVLYAYAARWQEYRKFSVEEDSFLDVRLVQPIFGIETEALVTAYYQKVEADVDRASIYDADSSRSADAPIPYILDIRNPNFPSGRFEDYDVYIR